MSPPVARFLRQDRILDLFRRRTSSGRYVPEIDGLRFLAILLVILFHQHHLFCVGTEITKLEDLGHETGNWFSYLPNVIFSKGWFGVQIFFVISGMVLALPQAAHYLDGSPLPSVRSYFLRRLVRIEVPYLLTLTLLFLARVFLDGGSFWGNLPHYGAGLVYLHWLFYDGALNPLLPVSWTLEIEIQFYLVVPFLCQIFRVKKAWIRRGILLVAIFLIQPLFEIPALQVFENSLLPRLDYFFAGMLLADIYLTKKDAPKSWRWDVSGLVLWGGLVWLLENSGFLNPKPLVLMIAFWAVLKGSLLHRIASYPWFTVIGTMCYSIYLFHEFFIYRFFNYFVFGPVIPVTDGSWPFNSVWMFLMAACVIVCCAGVYLVIEKPFARGRWPWSRSKG